MHATTTKRSIITAALLGLIALSGCAAERDPIPATNVCRVASAVSNTRLEIDIPAKGASDPGLVSILSVNGSQWGESTPALSVFHTPPPSVPT